MKELEKQSDFTKISNSQFGTTSTSSGTSSLKREKFPSWWPFRWDPSACSSSSAKSIGAGTMKKEDIKL